MPDGLPISTIHRRATISPLSAATLLLLVSMVVSASPSLRGGAEFADHRHLGARVVHVDQTKGSEQQRFRRAAHRADQLDRVPDAPGPWVELVAGSIDHSTGLEVAPSSTLLRFGLLDLPPPLMA